ncbi:MAG: hypothetical protein ACFFKA_02615 [Candidatus Thorarchaeota archaeon]
MRRINKISILLVFTFFCSFSLNNFLLKSVLGQISGDNLLVSQNFYITEYGNYQIESLNTNKVNLSLPSTKWRIEDIDLNFSNIKLGEEVVTIEEGGSSFKSIYKNMKGYGVQLNITQNLLLLGVHIYGYIDVQPKSPVYVQINGYNSVTNSPNNTVYGNPIPINISSIPNWYIQTFPEPIPLTEGYYYLVVNGSGYLPSDNSNHNWFLNELDSIHSDLYSSKFDGISWSIEAQGKPFRHKLIQRTNQSFFPESIDMRIQLNDTFYNITNGIIPNSGSVKISSVDIMLNDDYLAIPVFHNQTVSLLFNLSSNLGLKASLLSSGTCLISSEDDNQWNVSPTLFRELYNYSIKFNFPYNWDNIIIRRDGIDITSQVEINQIEKYVYIMNETIINDADWSFSAISQKIQFGLTVDRTEFYTGQELKFFVAPPILDGNYRFMLKDPLNDVVYNVSKIISPANNSFSYLVPLSALDGSYRALVFWYNNTDGGMTSQNFNIILPFTLDWVLIMNVSILFSISTVVLISSIILVKKQKQKKLLREEEITNRFMDILNLNYITVIEKKGSLSVYDQNFTQKQFDANLISGFLEAIRTFGIDLSGADEQSQTIKLEYRNNKILMSDYKSFRLIFIMKELPSSRFYKSIDKLSHEIENKLGLYLENFRGNLKHFHNIEELLKEHLGTSFLYPLKIVKTGKVKITALEKIIIGKANNIMKKKSTDYFYVSQLLEDKNFESKDIATVFSLIDKKLFIPVL